MGKIVFIDDFDIMKELKDRGYNPQVIRNKKILSQSTLTDMRKGVVPLAKLPVLCEMLGMQPGKFIRYESDIKSSNKTPSID